MDMAARTGAWTPSGAPLPYDAEVEYLESTGTQYFLPDVFAVSPLKMVAQVMFTTSSDSTLVGYYGSADDRFDLLSKNGANKLHAGFGSWWANGSKTVALNKLYVVESLLSTGNQYVKVDNVNEIIASSAGSVFHPNSRIAVFGRAGANNTIFQIKQGRLYSLKFYREQNLVGDFIFVRVSSEGAMYDRVSGQLFRNSGTGAFVIGPDVVSSRGGGLNA